MQSVRDRADHTQPLDIPRGGMLDVQGGVLFNLIWGGAADDVTRAMSAGGAACEWPKGGACQFLGGG